MKRHSSFRLALLLTLSFTTASFADTVIWTALGSDANWSTGGNWTNATAATSGTAPGAADAVQFFDSAATGPTVDGTIASLRFGSTNNDYGTTISSALNVNGTLRIGTPGDTATALVRTATFTGT